MRFQPSCAVNWLTGPLTALTALFLWEGIAMASFASEPNTYPKPEKPNLPELLGVNIQRSMRLMASSTPGHRNRVRVLFYGQSITEQEWSKAVANDLRKRFPNTDFDIRNLAIGGFASQLLKMPAEQDLYPFYPDLVIFHVYGSHIDYEAIIRSIRERTTADILMQTDHITAWPDPTATDQNKKEGWWDNFMNNTFLPATAKKYHCGLAQNHLDWLDYLKANHLEPKQLLKDGVHLNAWGNYLMASLVSRNLVYRPDLPWVEAKSPVRTFPVGNKLKGNGDPYTLTFEGNRIDLIYKDGFALNSTITVLLDGKKPSEFPGCYAVTRPTPGPWSPLTVIRVNHSTLLQLEDWTLKVTHVEANSERFQYKVTGTLTGEDGEGDNTHPFVSMSGRVLLNPDCFFRNGKIPEGYEVHWSVEPHFLDSIEATPGKSPVYEYSSTLAQGFPNGRHTLQLKVTGTNGTVVRALRIYSPPVKETVASSAKK